MDGTRSRGYGSGPDHRCSVVGAFRCASKMVTILGGARWLVRPEEGIEGTLRCLPPTAAGGARACRSDPRREDQPDARDRLRPYHAPDRDRARNDEPAQPAPGWSTGPGRESAALHVAALDGGSRIRARREALGHDPYPGRRDRVEPLADPARPSSRDVVDADNELEVPAIFIESFRGARAPYQVGAQDQIALIVGRGDGQSDGDAGSAG